VGPPLRAPLLYRLLNASAVDPGDVGARVRGDLGLEHLAARLSRLHRVEQWRELSAGGDRFGEPRNLAVEGVELTGTTGAIVGLRRAV
jgi:hypothetical protein